MRSRSILVVLIAVIAVLSIVVLLVNPPAGGTSRSADGVMVIRLYGAIQETGGGLWTEGAITPRLVERQLSRASRDPRVKAVVLRVSSPGGSIAASQEIYDLIRNFDKPIVVSMGDMAASGGYYIAAAADAIVAQPGTMTGSIGVITTVTNLEGLYDKLGIDVEIIKSGRHKDMFQRALTEEERQLLQNLNDEAWNQFVAAVAEGRGLEIEHVRNMATGEIFIGTQALELGLVDQLGGLDQAVQVAAELAGIEDPIVIEPSKPSFWELVMEASSSVVHALQGGARTMPVEWLRLLEGVPDIRYSLSPVS